MTEDRWIKRNAELEGRMDIIRAVVSGQNIVDLARLVWRQRDWSALTFGPARGVGGILAHIRKELLEIEAKPDDLEEWIDVCILAIDGAWRATGCTGEEFAAALVSKMAKNRARKWPAPGTVPDGEPVEHVRGEG
jgi:hypothetical protein